MSSSRMKARKTAKSGSSRKASSRGASSSASIRGAGKSAGSSPSAKPRATKRESSFVRPSPDEVRKAIEGVDWAAVDAMTDADIARQIAGNPDAAAETTGLPARWQRAGTLLALAEPERKLLAE